MYPELLEKKLGELEFKNARLRATLGTLIVWIFQSANSPISQQEVKKLLEMLGEDR